MKKFAIPSGSRTRCEQLLGLDRGLPQSCPISGKCSRRTRNLAAREFDPVLRIKLFEFSADASRKQTFQPHAENAGEDEQFEVRNAPLLILKARHRAPAGVPALQLHFDRKLVLGPPLLSAQLSHLGTDNVQFCGRSFDTCTLTAERTQSCRLYLTSRKNVTWISLD